MSYFISGLSPNVTRLLVVGGATAATSLAIMVPASIVTALYRVQTGPNDFEVSGRAEGIVIGIAALGAVLIPATAVGSWVLTKGMDEPESDSYDFSHIEPVKLESVRFASKAMAY